MIRKSHMSIALAGLALFASSQAFACSTSLWGAGLTGGAGGAQAALNGVVAGQPNGGGGGTATRYSGSCGLRAASVTQVVQDGTPSQEGAYISRFYAHVNYASGTPVIFRAAEGAPDAVNTRVFAIQYNRADQRFEAVNQAGVVTAIGAVGSAINNRFFHVHTSWTRATGALDVNITAPLAGAPPAPPANAFTAITANLTGFPSSSGAAGVDYVALGWQAGTASGTVNVDAFESRRSTAIPRLCRGDANNSGNISPADRSSITAELGLVNLAPGQPDCNEDGTISPADRSCVTALLGTGRNACADNNW